MEDPKDPLQINVNSNYQWEKLIETNKFLVIDVYSAWCGSCTSMVPTIQKCKHQFGSEITFATANADTISCLEKFRNKSEPTWLLLADGKVINVVYGSDSQKLLSTILSELKKESLIQKGLNVRTILEIDDIPKEEPALINVPSIKEPEKTSSTVPPNPLMGDEEFLYRPFRVTYYK